jgi:hypothetical protein
LAGNQAKPIDTGSLATAGGIADFDLNALTGRSSKRALG